MSQNGGEIGLEIKTELGNISQNQREYHDEIVKTLASSSNTQRQDNYRILTEVKNVAQDQHEFLNSADRDKIIEWLSPLNFFARHDDIFRTRQEGTGRWFLEDSRFKNWLLSTGESIWCLGIPGAGKTVLVSIVVDYLRSHFQSDNVGVAVAYLNHKESDAQSPSNILAGLWWQLVSKRPISPMVQQVYKKHQTQRTKPSLDEVRDIFRSTTAEFSKVFIIVDALDEYLEAHHHIVLDTLAMDGGVSLMLTSRPNIAPKAFFPTVSVLEISARDEDIHRYVEGQIQNSFRLSKHVRARPELREEIEMKIAENADGMFLLAKLHVDALATKPSVKAVREALQNLPEGLEHTYNEAMDRIDAQNKDDREIARRTLVWVANTKRPLTVSELQEALAIDPDSKALNVDGLLDIEIILSVCVGLVIIDASQSLSFVRLVHLTIQDYLDRVQPIRFPEAQTEITRACLTYISYNNIPKSLYDYRERQLLPYASYYCLLHAAGEPELLLRDHILQFLGDAHRWQALGPGHSEPLQWRYANWPPVPSKLWVAALFDLQEMAGFLLENDKSISEEEKAGSLNNALQWKCLGVIKVLIEHGTNGNPPQAFVGNTLRLAAKMGHTSGVQLLLEHGADVSSQGGEDGTALQAASKSGNMEIVQLLLVHGADVNTKAGYFGSALQAASWRGSMELAGLLIAKGADVNLQGGHYGTALQAASVEGEEGVVQLLLENGADVNMKGGEYGTALQAASWRGSMKVFQFLLKHGVNINARGKDDSTALQAASVQGHTEVVQLLLEHGADINLQGGHYGTSLQAASARGQEGVVKLLLKHGANVNLQGVFYGTALQAASWGENMEVVQLLLENGADVNAQGGGYGSALQAASWIGSTKVVQMLLEHGADVNAHVGYFGSALQAASWRGSMEVVQVLLKSSADVNLQGGKYGTALQAASAQGEQGVVQLLLKHGASVNTWGGKYGTALQAASAKGEQEVVQLLLKHGVSVNTWGGKYGTALLAASQIGSTEIVQLLLEHGANVHLQGGGYGSALQAASWMGNMKLVQMLLEHDADVNLQGGKYGTALQAASAGREEGVVRLLLMHGAAIDVQGGKYGTALQAASVKGEQGVVQLLLKHGASVNTWGGKYGTAYRAAKLKDHTEVADLLVAHGADTDLGAESGSN
ncbi:ankyrin repeat-containing domain protein [Mycena rebaudengoi]|nr:ankyrin repeat-containing domain protein [Mycena rebaudengoi]